MPLPDGDYEIQFGSGDRWAGIPAAHIDTFATLRIVPRSESVGAPNLHLDAALIMLCK